MSCDLTEKISLLIDGELTPAEVRIVERHLIDCVECRQARTDFLSLRQQIGEYATSFETSRQRQALASILGRPAPGPVRSRRRRARFRFAFGLNPAWVGAAALIIAVVSLVLYRNLRRDTNAPAPQVITAVEPAPSVTPRGPAAPNQTPTADSPQVGTIAPSRQSRRVSSKENVAVIKRPVEAVDFGQLIKPTEPAAAVETETVATTAPVIRSADSQTLTAMHFEKSELLLRSFRNLRLSGDEKSAELGYERQRAQQLVYQNIMLRREADIAGDVQVATLLESLEPILLDIANLPSEAQDDAVREIQTRVERKNIVALLQMNSIALARGLE